MSAQDRTLDQYQELMTINAAGHLLRAGRDLGVYKCLQERQHTAEQLAESIQIPVVSLNLLLDSLVAIGILERYEDDFALSSTARLLCQYDNDLGDSTWQRLLERIQSADSDVSSETMHGDPIQSHFDAIAATQWVHTPAAMQAAEILDTVGDEFSNDPTLDPNERDPEEKLQAESRCLLDLGCGSAVWSCALAHRDPRLRVTAVDHAPALESAMATAASIQLQDRFATLVGSLTNLDAIESDIEEGSYDYVLIAQRLHSLAPEQISRVLSYSAAACRSGGKVLVIDSFRAKARPTLAESIEALKLLVQTPNGSVPDLATAQSRMLKAGLESLQFTFIAASRCGFGLLVGTKP
ncbi:MAG: class I SAM-dependent methyltransferase [Planctomycetota bacterium]